MLHYRIYGFLRFSFERAGMKTKDFANIWKAALAPFVPSNYAPDCCKGLERTSILEHDSMIYGHFLNP